MNVVVNMLAGNDWSNGVALLLLDGARALELGSFLFETRLDSVRVAVLVVTLLNADHVVRVLLGKHLAILDRLDRGVVVVLMDLTVNGGLGLLMTLLNNVLVHGSRSNLLVDSGVMMTSF